MKVKHTDDDPIYFDHYDAEALHEILDTQHKIIEYTKKKSLRNYCKHILTIWPMSRLALDSLRCCTLSMLEEGAT